MLVGEIKSAIIKKIREAKYFLLIIDCTPNISYEEQISLIIRYVDMSINPIKVEEFFLGFLMVDESSGE